MEEFQQRRDLRTLQPQRVEQLEPIQQKILYFFY
jgi:hypothetical protein